MCFLYKVWSCSNKFLSNSKIPANYIVTKSIFPFVVCVYSTNYNFFFYLEHLFVINSSIYSFNYHLTFVTYSLCNAYYEFKTICRVFATNEKPWFNYEDVTPPGVINHREIIFKQNIPQTKIGVQKSSQNAFSFRPI